MRPSLSPLENGAYGTPSRVVSLVVGGPQAESVDGSELTKSRSDSKAAILSIVGMVLALQMFDGLVVLSLFPRRFPNSCLARPAMWGRNAGASDSLIAASSRVDLANLTASPSFCNIRKATEAYLSRRSWKYRNIDYRSSGQSICALAQSTQMITACHGCFE